MLEARGLTAAYDGIQALRGIDMRIAEGEMVALIGPNGAGKSTLLNRLSGVVPAHRGHVTFAGREIGRWPAHRVSRAGLLHVPEGRRVLGEMSILENLLVGELARGGRSSPYDLAAVFSLFPILEERKGLAARTLSGGQQQMLAIGRALMGAPTLLMLDEPSLGLSPIVTDQVFDAIATLNRQGLTILLVEQNAHRALAATSRAYVLEQGRIVHDGPSAGLAADERIIAHYLGQEPSGAKPPAAGGAASRTTRPP